MQCQPKFAAIILGVCLISSAARAQDARKDVTSASDPAAAQISRAAADDKTTALSLVQTIDPQLKADILHLLQVTHAVERAQMGIRVAFASMRPHLLSALPSTPNRDDIVAEYGAKMETLPQTQEFTDGLVAVYARYFSDEDIQALAKFYDTPAGQHFNEHSGDVATDSMRFGQQLAAQNMERIFAEVCRDYPELEGRAKFCVNSAEGTTRLAASPKPDESRPQK